MDKKTNKVNELKPFLSVVIIIVTLFTVVFFKMEVRQLGYSMLKEVRQYRTLQDRYRLQVIEYAQFTSPSRLNTVAKKLLTLNEAKYGQIIQLSGHQIAVPQ